MHKGAATLVTSFSIAQQGSGGSETISSCKCEPAFETDPSAALVSRNSSSIEIQVNARSHIRSGGAAALAPDAAQATSRYHTTAVTTTKSQCSTSECSFNTSTTMGGLQSSVIAGGNGSEFPYNSDTNSTNLLML